ncbi:50S ribosomal protein L32 [bacterium]|nr:50S ribosomal protein L32 [bacterium]
MAVPKKRTGHSAQGKRRSNWKATKPTTTKCPNCGAVVLAHTVCTACGQYKGKVVSRKAEGFVEASEVKEAKKAPKKSTKDSKKVEETKVEEVVEDVNAEEAVVEAPAEEVVEAVEEAPAEEKTEE